nr:biotin--[acetyl-CoA-carboxylase] ligase [Rhizohabitans arisaemae]
MLDSPYIHLDRPPLSEAALSRALIRPGSLWRRISVVERTGSTNADLGVAVRQCAPEGTVLIAEAQFAGRGRLGRMWAAPSRSGLTFSFVLRPEVAPIKFGWLSLLAGLAAASAVGRLAEVDVRLKWPNDLLIGERKLAGVLAERVDNAVIIGIGLNVSVRREELPVDRATSLIIENAACLDRNELLQAVLGEIERRYRDWVACQGDADEGGLRAAYLASCATIGQEIRVELPGERLLTGIATGVDEAGHLLVRTEDGRHVLSAGEVVHVRRR